VPAWQFARVAVDDHGQKGSPLPADPDPARLARPAFVGQRADGRQRLNARAHADEHLRSCRFVSWSEAVNAMGPKEWLNPLPMFGRLLTRSAGIRGHTVEGRQNATIRQTNEGLEPLRVFRRLRLLSRAEHDDQDAEQGFP